MKICFGAFVFDRDQRLVTRGDEPVHLTPKAMRLLEILIEERPRALSKAELLGCVWPDVVVEEGNLKSLVSELRRALNDRSQDSRFIRTVYGYGYSFSHDVRIEGSEPEFLFGSRSLLVHKSRELVLEIGENILGRGRGSSIVIDEKSVSRQHARVTVDGERVVLEDLGSKNGTFYGGRRIDARVSLRDGDEFVLGSARVSLIRRDLDLETASVDD